MVESGIAESIAPAPMAADARKVAAVIASQARPGTARTETDMCSMHGRVATAVRVCSSVVQLRVE